MSRPPLDPLAKRVKVRALEKIMGAATRESGRLMDGDYRSVQVRCSLANRREHAVRSVRGLLRFKTYFGKTLHELEVQEQVPLAPDQVVARQWNLQRDDFKDEESFQAFLETPLARLRQEWVPLEVVLSDGTTLHF